ncbi:hypothetical protein PLANPX_4943 [Lacipirellula parvula]|uniref:Uncharacterized protein n=1 Tax=Lacipirellula parvula TaxID=2650471 RepID=A0A5K7XJS6_9BACT|nr:hypothetical protein PLANPX_4943 [Lacipirellula parvula]
MLSLLGSLALASMAGCAWIDGLFGHSLRELQMDATSSGLNSPNEQVQADAVERQREVSRIYD